jgi:hypothetical protein
MLGLRSDSRRADFDGAIEPYTSYRLDLLMFMRIVAAGAFLTVAASGCDSRTDLEKEQDRLEKKQVEIRMKALAEGAARLDKQNAEWETSKGPAPMGGEACAASIGVLMSQDPRIMKRRKLEANRFSVRYTRDDGSVWEFRCDVTTSFRRLLSDARFNPMLKTDFPPVRRPFSKLIRQAVHVDPVPLLERRFSDLMLLDVVIATEADDPPI